jgi:hypothetical protein
MKKIKRLNFTLIEITVAFGVLAILIMFLMQFLNTAQTSWNFAEKRARAYADSRTFFDIAERAVQFSGYKLSDDGIFNVQDESDGNKSFTVKGLKPFGKDIVLKEMKFKVDGCELKIDDEPIISNVVSFYVHKNTTGKVIVMVIKMFGSEADYENYNAESDAGKKAEYFAQHGFIFTRLINLVEQ